MRKTRVLLPPIRLGLLATGLTVLATVPVAASTVTDPGGLGGSINESAFSLEEEAGNTTLATFNGYIATPGVDTYRLSFESSDGYGSSVTSVVLTSGGSGIDLTTSLSSVYSGSGSSFSRVVSGLRPTSGTSDINYGGGISEAIFSFSAPVDAVGFTLNRFGDQVAAVEFYADTAMTSLIGSAVSLQPNLGTDTERSFIGFTAGSREIRAVRILDNGNQQFSVDDFTVAQIPEPSAGLLAAAGIALAVVARRSQVRRTR
jgi:hypothetical protein